MADEAGISLSDVEGTGMGGRIRREDVERAVAARREQDMTAQTEPTAPAAEPTERAAEPTARGRTDGARGRTIR